MAIVRSMQARRLLWTSRMVWQEFKLPKETPADVRRRLDAILEDVPKPKANVPKPETRPVEETIRAIEKDKKSESSVMDTFNIKQIVDTVREGENFRKLQQELSNFYATKWKEGQDKQEAFSKRVDSNVKELRKSIAIASQVVNDVTGYSKVMKLREEITTVEGELRDLRNKLDSARESYQSALDLRSNSQKEVNTLLERKNSWDQLDLERFTKLYMNNHDLETAVNSAAAELKHLETQEEELHDSLIKAIMNRYHEEQTWSDKIRQFSTWATVLILCANVTLVVLVQLVFEPLKRWRLVSSFEGKVKELFQGNQKLEQDLVELKGSLQDFEDKLLEQMDYKSPFTFLGSMCRRIYHYLVDLNVRATNFRLTEPQKLHQHTEDMTRLGYLRVYGARALHILHYVIIHNINVGLVFVGQLKSRFLELADTLATSNELRPVAITALSSGLLTGLLCGALL